MPGLKHETLIRRYYDKATGGDERTIEELLDPEFVLHSPISNEPIRGIDGFKQMIAAYKAATPELKVHVEELKEDGDSVSVRWRARYKHTGEFRGHAATGKQGEVTGSDTIRIANGKIVEVRNNLDLDRVEREVGFKPDLKDKR